MAEIAVTALASVFIVLLVFVIMQYDQAPDPTPSNEEGDYSDRS